MCVYRFYLFAAVGSCNITTFIAFLGRGVHDICTRDIFPPG